MDQALRDMLNQIFGRSEEHTSELQLPCNLVCRLLLEKKKYHRRRVLAHPAHRHSPCSTPDPGADVLLRSPRVWAAAALGLASLPPSLFFFFFNDTATPEIYPLSLHDPLPI